MAQGGKKGKQVQLRLGGWAESRLFGEAQKAGKAQTGVGGEMERRRLWCCQEAEGPREGK